MKTFYTKEELLNFKLNDFKKNILGKSFSCQIKNKTFKATSTNVLAALPDNLFDEIEFQTEEGKNETVAIPDIERLTLID